MTAPPLPGVRRVCNQDHCDAPAAYLFTWPGRAEAGICEEHSAILPGLAQAMGFAIELRPIEGVARPDNVQRLAGVYAHTFADSYRHTDVADLGNELLRYLQAHADALTAVYELDR